MKKCVFLDRDGVLNTERGDYVYRLDDFIIPDGVYQALQLLQRSDYKLIVITNQGGISKGIYSREDMNRCHEKLMEATDGMIDAIFYSPYHPSITNSLGRKPGKLFFEKAIALYGIDPGISWMVGDKQSDLEPALDLGMKVIFVDSGYFELNMKVDYHCQELLSASKYIIDQAP